MIELFIVTISQMISSALSTATIHAAVSNSTIRFVCIAAISDAVKLTVIASVTIIAINGSFYGILAAVCGGAMGNLIAFKMRRKAL